MSIYTKSNINNDDNSGNGNNYNNKNNNQSMSFGGDDGVSTAECMSVLITVNNECARVHDDIGNCSDGRRYFATTNTPPTEWRV